MGTSDQRKPADEETIRTAAEILRAAADAIEDAPGWGDSEAARLREIAQIMEEEAGDEEQAIAAAMLAAAHDGQQNKAKH